MTIRDLRDFLNLLIADRHGDSRVYLSKDEEGNSFHPIDGTSPERIEGEDVLVLWPGWPAVYELDDE